MQALVCMKSDMPKRSRSMIETLKGFPTDAVAVRAGGFVTDAKRERILLTLGSWTASGADPHRVC